MENEAVCYWKLTRWKQIVKRRTPRQSRTGKRTFLRLGIFPSWIQPKTKNDRDLLAATRAVGAFRILAHPFHPFTPLTHWKTTDFDSMEIWNEDAAWRQNNFFDLLDALLLYKENDQLTREACEHSGGELCEMG